MAKIELVGKVVGFRLKDVGKGKDAEAHEVLCAEVKLNEDEGIRERCGFVVGGADLELGDAVNITIEKRQQTLGLSRRRVRTTAPDASH